MMALARSFLISKATDFPLVRRIKNATRDRRKFLQKKKFENYASLKLKVKI